MIESVVRHLANQPTRRIGGAMHQDVQCAEAFHATLDHGLDSRAVGDVATD
ncbi:hypothetical protein D3C81_1825790 [compost metagenome]